MASHLRALAAAQAVASTSVATRGYATDLAIRGVDAVAAGKGGRSSVSGVTATIFGCTGFLGRYVAQALGRQGVRLVLPYRCDDVDMQHLRTMGDLGAVVPLGNSDLRDPEHIARAISKSQLVINLVGADRETWNYSFEDVHVGIPQRITEAVKSQGGVQRFVHVSALGASPDAASKRLRTKAAGEEVIKSELGDIATIFKLAHLTGTEDRLFNNYARLAKSLPFVPLADGGHTQLQPVWVRDVTTAMMNSLLTWDSLGKTYHLAGPDVFTVKQLVEFTFETIREPDSSLYFPSAAAKLAGRTTDWLAAKTPFRMNHMFSEDFVDEMAGGNYVLPNTPGLLTFNDLDVKPHRVTEGIPIEYLRFYRSGGYDFGSTAEHARSGNVASGMPQR